MKMEPEFTVKVLDGLSRLRAKIYDEMEERPFRHDFANIIIGEVLGWTRERGKGHYEVSEIRDITCFDDKEFPVVIVETKAPAESLEPKYVKKLEERLKDSGAEYGVLTNGHKLDLYSLDPVRGMTKIAHINIDAIAQKEVLALAGAERQQIAELKKIERIRFLRMDVDYLISRHRKAKVSTDEGFHYLIQSLRFSLDELTRVLVKFFDLYMKSKHIHADFLKDSFRDWCYISGRGKPEEAKEIFCKETAYVLLNRILFTRVCEDKGILGQRLSGQGLATGYREREKKRLPWLRILKDACEDAQEWYEHFYMLSMFDWWEIPEHLRGVLKSEEKAELEECEKDLNDAIGESLKRFNPFDFGDVDRDILGHVYQEYLPPDERKRLGEFYTPIEVVRYILDMVGYAADSKIEDKYLLDPACGSGTFLVEAVTRLTERYRKKGLNLDDSEQAKLVLEGIIEHIYGLDINPFACHIAEMNLLFHVIEIYEKVREKDRRYKLPRFNIYRTDSLMPPEMGIKLTLEKYVALNARAKAFLDEEKEASKVKKMGFDFVVGNPPYVRSREIPMEYKKNVLKREYPQIFCDGNDLAVYFIAKAINLLKKEGFFGYIVTGQFTKSGYGRYINAYIPLKCRISHILDARNSTVFKEVSNYPIILILQQVPEKEKQIRVCKIFKDLQGETWEESLKSTINHTKKHYGVDYRDEYIHSFKISQELFLRDLKVEKEDGVKKHVLREWILEGPSELSLREKIEESSSSLKEICEVHEGLHTGLHKRTKGELFDPFIVDETTIQSCKLEKEILKPVLEESGLVKKYSITYNDKYLIYVWKSIDIKKYPRIEAYLSKFREELSRRKCVKRKEKQWFELKHPKKAEYFEEEKIITPDISNKNNFGYDDIGYYCLNTCYVINPTREWKNKHGAKFLVYLLGILNSKLIEFYIKQISPHVRGGWYRYKTGYLERVPIRFPQNPREKQIADLLTQQVDKILQLNKQLDELERKINIFPERYLEGIEKLDRVTWVMESQELKKKSYKVSNPRVESFKDLSGQTKYRLILAKGNHITFGTKEQAEYVLNWLRGRDRVSKNEILELEIPSEDYLRKIMKEYEDDRNEVNRIKNEIKVVEEEIDELVFDLYGLSKDKEVINSFLEKTRA